MKKDRRINKKMREPSVDKYLEGVVFTSVFSSRKLTPLERIKKKLTKLFKLL